jgi:hypothetical protein
MLLTWRLYIINEIQDILKSEYRFFTTEKRDYFGSRLNELVLKF